jgi:DNA helicase HerA-like ATPase
MTAFTEMLEQSYRLEEPSLVLGAALEGPQVHPDPKIRLPLSMANRHGLVAGATGTGKTKTLQLLTEQLSAHGVPVFVADMKGDLSGLAMPGESTPRVSARATDIGWDWQAKGVPVEFVSLTGASGVQLRATVSSFGPLLLGKVLSLNDTQTSVLTMVFKYADDNQLPLLDFQDLRSVLQYLTTDDGKAALSQYGGMSGATVGVLLRRMIELESQGAGLFFGEPEFEVHDLLQLTSDGRGVVTCLELPDVADKPRLFSTFMMWMLAELYHNLPEVGDLAKPKLVFFFDEAHLLFDDAPKAFLEQIEQVVRLIRSKGVGVYFVTQTPKDVPEGVLAQLGNRIQHALRAHTPDDDKALRATVRTFPKTAFYDLAETLTSLGVGEAVVTVLNARGVPSPVVAMRMIPPASRMAPLTPEELQADIRESAMVAEYGKTIDRESAREMLAARLARATVEPGEEPSVPPASRTKEDRTMTDMAGDVVQSPLGKTVVREVVRGLFGLLGVKTQRRTTTTRRRRW